MGDGRWEMAGVPGFEPGMAVPKTTALPLGYTPTKNVYFPYIILRRELCKG